MTKCPSCNAILTDADIQAALCSACGKHLASSESTHQDMGETSHDDRSTVDENDIEQTLDSINIPVPPSLDDRDTIDDNLPDQVSDSLGQKDNTPEGRLDQTLDSVDLPLSDFANQKDAIPEGRLDETLDSVDLSSNDLGIPKDDIPEGRLDQTLDSVDLPPSKSVDKRDTVSEDRIDQTLDSVDLSSSKSAEKGDTVSEDRIDQTLDSVNLSPNNLGNLNDDIPEGRLDQTLDSVDVPPSDVGDEKDDKATVAENPIAQTLDSSEFSAVSGSQEGGTVAERQVAQTLDNSDSAPDVADRINATWGGTVNQDVDLGTSIKTEETGVDDSKSTLVIQARSFQQAEPKQQSISKADYNLIKLLGEGGMGMVYAARQASIDRTVAIKMLKPKTAADTVQRNKFLSEAVVTGELDHPNIVPIYDLGTNDKGALFYAMKRVVGTPWMDVIQDKSLHENIEILMKVADAIAFAHDRKVLHRDLKPENIMLGGYGEVLVMDWGLAIPTDRRKIGGLTQSVSMGGTPAYMAPEMATGPFEQIGPASDVYLLGAMLFEIVTGDPPHTGKDVMKCLLAAAKNVIRPTEKSGELIDIAMTAMAAKPKDRYPSVQEFQNAIRDYLSHSESIALSTRAAQDLEEATNSNDYQDYSRARFGYQEALSLWDGNEKAKTGLSEASVVYAESALNKGDLDLGISLLDPDDATHHEILKKIQEAQQERDARQRRLKTLRRTMVIGAAVFVLVVTGAGFWIFTERNKALTALGAAETQKKKALAAKDEADLQRANAEEQTKEANRQKEEADRQTKLAVAAKVESDKQTKLAVTAKEESDKQTKLAVAAKVESDKQTEIAKAEKKIADDAKIEAQKQTKLAVAAEKNANRQRDKAEYETYIALIGLADAKIEENAFGTARQLLDQCPSKLRNWEWGRLMHLCDQNDTEYQTSAPVDAIAYSRDGKRFITGGWNGLAKIWDANTVKELQTIDHGNLYFVYAVAFSPDGKYVATGCDDETGGYLRIWNSETGTLVRKLDGHSDAVVSIQFSRDGKQLLTGSYDHTAMLWDVETGKVTRTLYGHRGWVWTAAFSPDETRVVTASQDGFAFVWSLDKQPDEKGVQSPPFRGHQGPIYSAAFSPDGQSVVTGGYDKRVLIWRPDEIEEFEFKKVIANQLLDANKKKEPITPPKFRSLDGHTAAVRSVAFSTDGLRVLSGGHDNTVRVWNVESGSLLKTLRGHNSWVRACAFSPDGKWVLSGSHDRLVMRWSLERYEEVRRVPQGRILEGHSSDILAASFSKDGQHIVTASRDRTAKTWNFHTGLEEKNFIEGHSFLASSIEFFAGGKQMVTGAVDNTVRIWNVTTGTEMLRFDDTGRSAAIAVSPDGKWILTGSNDNSAKLWELTTVKNADGKTIPQGVVRRLLKDHRVAVTAVAFSSNGQMMLTGDSNGRCNLWDFKTGKLLHSLRAHTGRITAVAFLSDNSRAITASGDKTVAQWDVTTGREQQRLILKHPAGVTSMAVSAKGNQALTSCADGKLRLWDLDRAKSIHTLVAKSANQGKVIGEINSVAISRDGRLGVTVNSEARDVRIWDLQSGSEIQPSVGVAGPYLNFNKRGLVWAANFSPDGSQLVTVGGDNARLWDFRPDIRPKKETMVFIPHGTIASASYSHDGTRVVTSSFDGSARIWNVKTGKGELKLEGHHRGYVNSAVFSPDGKVIVTASNDNTAILWDANTGKVIRKLEGENGHTAAVHWATYSVDGKYVLTASEDTTARIWEAATGKLVKILKEDYPVGHRYGILRAEFSRDTGKLRVITASKDNTAKIWDVETGKVLLAMAGHTAAVTSVSFSKDGKRALTGSEDFSAKLWDATTQIDDEQVEEEAGEKQVDEKQADDNAKPVRVKFAAKAKEIMTLKGHEQEVTSVSFSNDGVYALTASRDGTAIIWLAQQLKKEGPAVAVRGK